MHRKKIKIYIVTTNTRKTLSRPDADTSGTQKKKIILYSTHVYRTIITFYDATPEIITDPSHWLPLNSSSIGIFFFFFLICLRWAGPRPHIPFPTRPHFLYVNLFAMGPVHLSPVTWPQALRYWYSLTSLMHIVAQLRPIDLHNFQAKYQRVVSFWVPVDYPSLNELVSMPGL